MTELAIAPASSIQPLTVQEVVNNRDTVKTAMLNAMVEGTHYGLIPGCGDKPTLLQPGAQILCHLFRLRPQSTVTVTQLENGHREINVHAQLFHLMSGVLIAEGYGLATTMETRYRYRSVAAFDPTGDPVPGTYWEMNKKDGKQAKEWLEKTYGVGAGTKKVDGSWQVVIYKKTDEKAENPNIADVYNPVLKIAIKRAIVAATITATASSDLFTQDIEDGFLDSVQVIHPTREEPKALPAPHTEAQIQGWREVVSHKGRKGGAVLNRKLGTMDIKTLKDLRDALGAIKLRSQKDNHLLASVTMGIAELDKAGDDIPFGDSEEGMTWKKRVEHRLQAKQILLGNFMKVAVNESWIKSGVFDTITEEEAQHLCENWEYALEFFGKGEGK